MDIRKAAIVLTLFMSFFAQAQQNESLASQVAMAGEIQVTGEIAGNSSSMQLRLQMMDAEKKVYEIFNKYNDEKRFTVHCSMQQPVGTRIESQVCTTQFENEAARVHAQAYYENTRETITSMAGCGLNTRGCQPPVFSYPMLNAPTEVAIASQHLEYKRKLKQVAEENPEFLNAIVEFSEMQQRYNAATSMEE